MAQATKKSIQKLPLAGKSVVVTRSKDQSSELCSKIEAMGGEALELPLIEVTPFCEPSTLEDVFAEIASYEWIVFTSVNGVKNFFNFFFNQFKDIRCLGGMRIACIGKATVLEVEKYHLQVDLVPEEALSENLVEALLEIQTLDNLKVLVITGNRNREVIVKELEEKGQAIVDTLQVYETQFTDVKKEATAKTFTKDGADAIVFTSSSTVQSFAKQAGALQLNAKAKKPSTFSIGPITSKTMKEVGMPVDAEAKDHSIDGLIDMLKKKLK